jgi:hypothetical protein
VAALALKPNLEKRLGQQRSALAQLLYQLYQRLLLYMATQSGIHDSSQRSD